MPYIEDGKERVFMKITRVLVDLLIKMAPEIYGLYVVFDNSRKLLYVQVLRALYRMFIAALLWCKQYKLDLEKQGIKFNPYYVCFVNKIVNKK